MGDPTGGRGKTPQAENGTLTPEPSSLHPMETLAILHPRPPKP